MDSAESAPRLLEPQDAFVTPLEEEEAIVVRPLYVADAGGLPQSRWQGLYTDMITVAPGHAVTGLYEPSAFSFSPATNETSTRETHTVGTDALFFDTPSLDAPFFYTHSFNTPSLALDTPHLYTPSFYASSFDNPSYTTPFDTRFFDHIMMSPFGTSQPGPVPNAGHQRCFPEPSIGDWPPLPGSSSLDRSVGPNHPQVATVPAPAQSGGNLGKPQEAPQPNLIVSASSSAPAAAPTSPNDAEAAYVICKWDGCRALVDATKDAVKAHLKEAHHADFSAHSRGKGHGVKDGCKWEGCTRRPTNNLWRHVFEIHARVATKVQCDKCPATFTRPESLRRHLHSHACRTGTGVDDPNPRIHVSGQRDARWSEYPQRSLGPEGLSLGWSLMKYKPNSLC